MNRKGRAEILHDPFPLQSCGEAWGARLFDSKRRNRYNRKSIL